LEINSIVIDCDRPSSVSFDPGKGGKLAGVRKISCRLLFAAE
jgi:hypothetical protein